MTDAASLVALSDLLGSVDSEKLRMLLSAKHGKNSQEKIEQLKTLHARYQERYKFAVGDLVTWKEGLKDRAYPESGEPIIVLHVLSEPIFDPNLEAGSPYFRNAYDLICGVMVKDAFLAYHFESARLMPLEKL